MLNETPLLDFPGEPEELKISLGDVVIRGKSNQSRRDAANWLTRNRRPCTWDYVDPAGLRALWLPPHFFQFGLVKGTKFTRVHGRLNRQWLLPGEEPKAH